MPNKACLLFLAGSIVTGALILSGCAKISPPPLSDTSKGQWGRLRPIADNNHPNLYYNQSEIDELRNMILVQHDPQHLSDNYFNHVRGMMAITTDPNAPV